MENGFCAYSNPVRSFSPSRSLSHYFTARRACEKTNGTEHSAAAAITRPAYLSHGPVRTTRAPRRGGWIIFVEKNTTVFENRRQMRTERYRQIRTRRARARPCRFSLNGRNNKPDTNRMTTKCLDFTSSHTSKLNRPQGLTL